MGRLGKTCVESYQDMDVPTTHSCDSRTAEEFRMLGERFRREKPREVPMLVDAAPVLVFTDGRAKKVAIRLAGSLFFLMRVNPVSLDLTSQMPWLKNGFRQ